MKRTHKTSSGRAIILGALSCLVAAMALADLRLGVEEYVQSGGLAIDVPGYSVPSTADWNDDGLSDLIVGEGGTAGKVRVYINIGAADAPAFDGYVYAQAGTTDLVEPGSGCLGVFPRVVYWDGDGKKDLITGRSDGTVKLYTNVASDDAPAFDEGVLIEVGPLGSKIPIDIGSRATPTVVDWNEDGRKDLVAGAIDGRIHVFLNTGTDEAPDFEGQLYAQDDGSDLLVPSVRSSPHVLDFDHDGKKDVLTGNTNGELVFYSNVGTDETPIFSGYYLVEADSVTIDLPGTSRSRPFVCEWNEDDFPDVLIGYGDGLVRVYTGIEHDHGSGVPQPVSELAAILLAPCPNPTRGRSVLAFELPCEQKVRLTIYDVSGRRVARPADRSFGAGRHEAEWRGTDDRGRALPSSVYFVRMEAGTSEQTRRLVLLR